jgi:ribulose-phosphate 3-epimerase
MILVMTVYPGYGGQKIIRETFQKVRDLRRIINERGLDVDIEVDGGVNLDNIEEIMEAGANVFVAGTKVFEGDIAENVKNFRQKFDSGSIGLQNE